MFISKQWIMGLMALAMAASACLGEEPKQPEKFYKMEFVIKEVSGSRVVNSRTYTTIVSGVSKGEIRAGSKIPFRSDREKTELIDVGVNVDVFNLREVQDRLGFNVVAEVSSLAEEGNDSMRPTIRQNRWNSNVVIPLRKATLIFSSDNVDAKSQMQVEVTASPIP